MTMSQRVYIDTSVVGGFFDDEFKIPTQKLFERLQSKELIFVISDLLELELINAPKYVRELLLNYSNHYFERVELTEETLSLADQYIADKVVGRTSLEDCRHIALATINEVDVLASWNFKHIVNLDRIKGYNSVNLKLGYREIEIRTPQELVSYGE
ncbi:MAG: PIN domain protein [Bacteroidota bacterium]